MTQNNEDKTTDLGTIVTTLLDAMRVISRLAIKHEFTEEDRVECELITEQFEADFNNELLNNFSSSWTSVKTS